eukprot:scaffold577887_cov16-Prasinocladus_malaysianus.AAC.1
MALVSSGILAEYTQIGSAKLNCFKALFKAIHNRWPGRDKNKKEESAILRARAQDEAKAAAKAAKDAEGRITELFGQSEAARERVAHIEKELEAAQNALKVLSLKRVLSSSQKTDVIRCKIHFLFLHSSRRDGIVVTSSAVVVDVDVVCIAVVAIRA